MTIRRRFLTLIILVSCWLSAVVASGTVPKVGDPAPGFSLPAVNGNAVSLKDYVGKRKVVLVFYRGYW